MHFVLYWKFMYNQFAFSVETSGHYAEVGGAVGAMGSI